MNNDLDEITRFDREFAALSREESIQLAWRNAMRLLHVGLGEMEARDCIALLRMLLVTHLFLNNKIDARTMTSAVDARDVPSALRRSSPRFGVAYKAARNTSQALLDSGESVYWAARVSLDWFNESGRLVERHPKISDIRQIKGRIPGKWQRTAQLPSMMLVDVPANQSQFLSGQWRNERQPLHPFWIDWYQHVVNDEVQNWDLLCDITLIDDVLWQQGGEALEREIGFTAERHRLLEEVRRLRAELAEASTATESAALPHRGHNQPPELLSEDAPEVIYAVQTIAEQLSNAEEELQQHRPSRSRLRQIARTILKTVTLVATYCARLCDKALNSAADEAGKSLGKWLAPGLFAYILSQTPALKHLAEALISLAK